MLSGKPVDARPAWGAWPAAMTAPDLARPLGALLGRLEPVGLGILLAALFFPASPTTATGIVYPETFSSLWTLRIGPANIFEIAIALWIAAWLVRGLVTGHRESSFDRPLLALGVFLAALHVISLPANSEDVRYLTADAERIALLAAGYFVASRCARDTRWVRWFCIALAAVLAVRGAQLVLSYGLTGETEFKTILGREALLMTEDTLLLVIPVVLAWGALVDGRLRLLGSLGAALLTVTVLIVDLLSLRRGAVLMIGAAVAVRSLAIGRRRLALGLAAVLAVFALTVAAGPGRVLLDQVRYTVTSSLLRSDDASSSQRQAELENFGRNVNGADWLVGRGVGTLWRAEVAAPIDPASFGGGEGPLTRLGWHVYGLDWAYKFGLLGLAAVLGIAVLLARRLREARRRLAPPLAGILFSLAVCAVPLLLLSFTNPRLALAAGVVVGLLSRLVDLRGDAPGAGAREAT